MTLVGWYLAVAALVFAFLLDFGPEAAAIGAALWPLSAAFFIGFAVLVIASMAHDAWRRP